MPGWPEPGHIGEPEGPRGRFEKLPWAHEKLVDDLEVRVYLPAGYDESGERYPLLVVYWGDEALRFGSMANSLDHLLGLKVAPMVVAFVSRYRHHGYLNPTLLDNLTEALVSDLVPELESRYRTIAERGSRAIMGTFFAAAHAPSTRP